MAESDHEREIREAKEAAEKAAQKTKYYRSDIAGLTVSLGGGEFVRFVPYYERVNGDDTKVGYLETSDMRVIEACESDYHTVQISKKEFTESTKEEIDDVTGNTLGARRAAY